MARSRRYADDFQHELFGCWHKHRQQALWRGEEYALTPEDFFALWPPHLWQQRGRGRDDLCLVRIDDTMPWRKNNCQIIQRLEQLRKTNKRRKQRGPYMSYRVYK